jgi:hypothetical protein
LGVNVALGTPLIPSVIQFPQITAGRAPGPTIPLEPAFYTSFPMARAEKSCWHPSLACRPRGLPGVHSQLEPNSVTPSKPPPQCPGIGRRDGGTASMSCSPGASGLTRESESLHRLSCDRTVLKAELQTPETCRLMGEDLAHSAIPPPVWPGKCFCPWPPCGQAGDCPSLSFPIWERNNTDHFTSCHGDRAGAEWR